MFDPVIEARKFLLDVNFFFAFSPGMSESALFLVKSNRIDQNVK